MATFHITPTSDSVELDENGNGEVTYAVTNASEAGLRCRAKIVTEQPDRAAWFTIQDDPERPLPAGKTTQYTVAIAVPAETAAGDYSLRLDAVDADRSDDVGTEGQSVGFHFEPQAKPTPFPWWIVAVAGGAVLVIGIVLAIVLWPSGVTVPDVMGKPFADASAALEDLGLVVDDDQQVGEAEENVVLAQDPPAGTKVKKNTEVKITREAPFVDVPDLVGMKQTAAADTLDSLGLELTRVDERRLDPNNAGNVIEQELAAGDRVRSGTPVWIAIEAPLRTVPNVVGMQATAAITKLEELGLGAKITLQKIDASKGGQVVAQVPSANQIVQKGAELQLTAEEGRIQAPNVTGIVLAKAQEQIAALDLKSKVLAAIVVQGGTVGTVGVQSPPPDTPLAAGDTLTLSPVGKSVNVPSVMSKTQAAGTSELKAAGLKVKVRSLRDKANKGKIMRQEPAGGLALAGSTVTIWVATDQRFQVPTKRVFSPTEAVRAVNLGGGGG